MTTLHSIGKQTISERDVKQYLTNNTDFFKSHVNLLSDLEIPHESGKAVSLVERQVSILRDQKKQLKRQLQELVQLATENDLLNKQLHKLAMALYKADSVAAVLEIARARLKNDYKVDESNFLFFASTGGGDDGNVGESTEGSKGAAIIDPFQLSSASFDSFIDIRDPEFKGIEKVISERKPICGQFKPELTKALFGGVAMQVKSAALLPLVNRSCFGLLCIGSHDAHWFHAAKGTEFLKKLSELISCSLSARQ